VQAGPESLKRLEMKTKSMFAKPDGDAILTRSFLGSLKLEWAMFFDFGFGSAFASLKGLRDVRLQGNGVRFVVEQLLQLPRLKKVSLTEMEMIAMPLAALATLHLEALHVGLPIKKELSQLKELPLLPKLRLSRNNSSSLPTSDKLLEAAAECQQLTALSIKETVGMVTLPLDAMLPLRRLLCLSALSLRGIVFTSDSWKPIVELPRLNCLRLRNCHAVSDAFLKALEGQRQLVKIELIGCSGYSADSSAKLALALPHASIRANPVQ